MKRYIPLLAIIFFPVLSAFPQGFKAGLTGGLATTQVAGDQLSGFNKAGLILGGLVRHALSERSFLQMEIVFIQKGSRKPYDKETGTLYIMRLSYIEVPVHFQYKVTSKFIGEVGLSYATLIFSEEEDEYGIEEYRPPFYKYDFSGSIGLNYLLSDTWTFNARFSNSIIPIRGDPMGLSFSNFDRGQYNTVLAFTFQYHF